MSKYEPKIKRVENNKEKQEIYTKEMERYNLAMENEFYLEAVAIDYATIEDRLNSFLFHSGCCNRELEITKEYKEDIMNIWKVKDKDKEKINLQLNDKYNYIKNMLKWANKNNKEEDNPYKVALKSKIKNIDAKDFNEHLDNLKKWSKGRNEIIHGLLNKNVADLESKLKYYAEEGYNIARDLDNVVKSYKKTDNIRKSLNIG